MLIYENNFEKICYPVRKPELKVLLPLLYKWGFGELPPGRVPKTLT